MPDVKGREQILQVHVRKIPLNKDTDLKVLARTTPGFSGADLANLVNEAALLAARYGQIDVTMKDMETAKDKVMMGVERKSMIISDEEKKSTAYHEAGHALVAQLIPQADPIHKVTIIPRGMALGITQQLPLDDRYTYSKDYLEAQLSVLLAGRVAEIMLLGQTTTGAANDFEKATEIARKMVCLWGMSELGPLTYGETNDLIFLGRDLAMNKNFSERTAELIDEQVKKIINKSYAASQELLEQNKRKLLRIAKALLEKEVLDSDEIAKLAGVRKKAKPKTPAPPRQTAAPVGPADDKKGKPEEPSEVPTLDKPGLVKA
jgi:cell division protease FtsH